MVNYLDGFGKETCSHCGLRRTEQGHDGCVGHLDGVMNACCGHGQNSAAYVQFDYPEYDSNPNMHLIEGEEAILYIKEHSKRRAIACDSDHSFRKAYFHGTIEDFEKGCKP